MVEKMPTPGESEEEQRELFDEEEVTDEDAEKVIKLTRKPKAEPGKKEEQYGEKQHEMFREEELMDPAVRDMKELNEMIAEADERAKKERKEIQGKKRKKRTA